MINECDQNREIVSKDAAFEIVQDDERDMICCVRPLYGRSRIIVRRIIDCGDERIELCLRSRQSCRSDESISECADVERVDCVVQTVVRRIGWR